MLSHECGFAPLVVLQSTAQGLRAGRGWHRAIGSREKNKTAVATTSSAGVNGHGYMTQPPSRQYEAYEANGWPNEVAECAAAS